MMVGPAPTSVAQVLLFTNWLLEANFNHKWQQLKSNKIFWALVAFYLLHLLGLCYTENLEAGINDVRTKIPLLLAPIVFFSSKPLVVKEFHAVLISFLIGCTINVTWCLLYSFVLHHNELVRNGSRFMSHIRLGLFINLAISCCVYLFLSSSIFYKRLLLFFLSAYFVFVLYKLGLASGLVNFFILSFIGLCIIIYRQKLMIKLSAFILLITCAVFVSGYVFKIKEMQLCVKNTPNNLPLLVSPSGNKYIHFDTLGQKENGNYVLINIQLQELKNEWQKQFPKDSFSYMPNPHNLKRYEVLVRYLASKGLNKDSVGISKLSAEDKINIQQDITNFQYKDWSYLHKRTYELINEYDDFLNARNINGHSLTMRLYFWQAAVQVIQHHFWFGTGTGDVQAALNEEYIRSKSPLSADWYKRPHNQFLTAFVSLGIIGVVLFLLSIIYPVVLLKNYLPILFWPFFILSTISFLTEDTLETQAGISFYAIFNALFISIGYFKKQQTPEDLSPNH